MRMFTTSLTVLCASACFGVSAFAQSPAVANPIAAGVRTAWEGGKRNLTRSAELMPEKDYGFRPVETVRTFGQILAHVRRARSTGNRHHHRRLRQQPGERDLGTGRSVPGGDRGTPATQVM